MLLTLQRFQKNVLGARITTAVHRWSNVAPGRRIANTAAAVTVQRSTVDLTRTAVNKGSNLTKEVVGGKGHGIHSRSNDERNDQGRNTSGHRPFLSSVERFIASRPSNSQLDSFIHRRLSSPQYLRRYRDNASRAALLEQLVQLLIAKRCYVQAASVYNRLRNGEGYIPASRKNGGEGLKTETMMLGIALAVSEKDSTAPATEIDDILSTFATLFRHTSSDRLLLDLVKSLSDLGAGDPLKEHVVWVYIRCREESSSSGYAIPQSIVSLLAGILTRQGKVQEALEFVERCEDSKGPDSQDVHAIARSHPYNTILASLSPFPAHEGTDIIDLVLSIMSSRGIPTDKSLINILMRDQADRANGYRQASVPSPSTQHEQHDMSSTPSTIDDASEIDQIWDYISGHSEHPQIDRETQKKQERKEQLRAFEKVFTLYGTLCRAHAAQVTQDSAVLVNSKQAEAISHSPSFRPDFFTYRTLWDLLVRRPKWCFSSSSPTARASTIAEAPEATNRTRDVIEDEYGFDLTIESDIVDAEPTEEQASCDDDPEASISPVLPPRALFRDMMRYHFSHLTPPSHSSSIPTQTSRQQGRANTLDSKSTAQSQFLLNTALLTFLNRSPSCRGADYAAAMVVLRCFDAGDMSIEPLSASGSVQREADTPLQTTATMTTEESTSPYACHLPPLPVPLRTYRILAMHLLQCVTKDMRLALKQGAGRGSIWARWVLGTGAGDLRQFRRLLSSNILAKYQENLTEIAQENETRKATRVKKPTEKIIERILNISSSRVPNGAHLPSSSPSVTSTASSSLSQNPHLSSQHGFHNWNHHYISPSTTKSAPSMSYVPSYAQIFRLAPLPFWMYYPDRHKSYVKSTHGTQDLLRTRSLSSIPLEMMIKRAWVASRFMNNTDFPESVGGMEEQEMKSEEDIEIRRMKQLLKVFEREVEKAWKEMVPL
ncbi:hypothetical protein EV360DRAFT_85604 [Lentinula raphanica]|nr:hypothetical protein EV360DRAFT_85604 [Lentinula raphanica]